MICSPQTTSISSFNHLPKQDFAKKTVRNFAGLSTVWLIHNPRSSEAGPIRKRHASVRRALNWPSKGGFPVPVPGAHTLKSEHGYLLTIFARQIHSHFGKCALVIAMKRTAAGSGSATARGILASMCPRGVVSSARHATSYQDFLACPELGPRRDGGGDGRPPRWSWRRPTPGRLLHRRLAPGSPHSPPATQFRAAPDFRCHWDSRRPARVAPLHAEQGMGRENIWEGMKGNTE